MSRTTVRLSFNDSYRRKESEILKMSRGQRIVGLDHEDVVAEMKTVFWKAWSTYSREAGDKQLTLIRWFWVLWMHRKADLIEHYMAQKRSSQNEMLYSPEDIAELVEGLSPLVRAFDLVPTAPTGSNQLAEQVWGLIASGHNRDQVISLCKINKNVYYRIIGEWRNNQVKEQLTA